MGDNDATTPAVEMRVDGSPGTLGAVGGAVRSMAIAAGLHPDRSTRLRAVVEELVREATAREHEGDVVEIAIRVRPDGPDLRVEVTDRGLPMTGAESRAAPSRRLAALGFVDQLHISTHGSRGNVAECSVSVATADRHDDLGEVLDPNAPDATEDEAASIEVRPMEPADAMGLARCIYRCYGYSYKDRSLYEPRHIAHLLRTGLMRSVVAVSGDGEVIGHSALFVQRAGDRVPEAGKLVVDPRYRGHHLAERMAGARLEAASSVDDDRDGRGDLPGVWAQAVTNHPASQREVLKLGGAEVGLLIGASPASVVMADLANVNEGRRSLVAMYTPLQRTPATIDVPAAHTDFLAGLADAAGLERRLTTADAEPTGHSKVRTMVVPDAGVAFLRIERLGHDTLARVGHELDGLDPFDLGAVHLDLPLAEPGAGRIGTELERLGFCLAAWLPDFAPSGDVLRLQQVGSHPVDVEHVVCARPEGEHVRDYVIADWHRVRRGGLE